MAKKEFKKEDEQLQQVDAALSNTGKWIEEHSKMLMIAVAAVVLIVLGVILAITTFASQKQSRQVTRMQRLMFISLKVSGKKH